MPAHRYLAQKKLEHTPATTIKQEKNVKGKQKKKQPSKRKATPRIDHFLPGNDPKSNIGIHNLSSRTFTPQQLQLLQKGLSFAPSPVIPTPLRHKYY